MRVTGKRHPLSQRPWEVGFFRPMTARIHSPSRAAFFSNGGDLDRSVAGRDGTYAAAHR